MCCRCEPAPGSARDDAQRLPWREQLEGALQAAFGLLKSPTEHESNPVIAGAPCSAVLAWLLVCACLCIGGCLSWDDGQHETAADRRDLYAIRVCVETGSAVRQCGLGPGKTREAGGKKGEASDSGQDGGVLG